jgi:hypothetical protein
MSIWVREIVGWLLLLAGLTAFAFAGWLLLIGAVIEASTMTFIGFIVFRGGMHFLKVAIAVRLYERSLAAEAARVRRPR